MQSSKDDIPARGDDRTLFAGAHHARRIEPHVPYHVISRIFQGRCLLVPNPELNDLIAGVVGRAQALFSSVTLFAITVLSNHIHALLMGPPDQVPAFLGSIKREISRRYGRANPMIRRTVPRVIDWSATDRSRVNDR